MSDKSLIAIRRCLRLCVLPPGHDGKCNFGGPVASPPVVRTLLWYNRQTDERSAYE
jgi:hypothetical protein